MCAWVAPSFLTCRITKTSHTTRYSMKIRVRLPSGVKELDLDADAPWIQFLLMLSDLCGGCSPYALKVLSGFPPKTLQPESEVEMVSALLRDGEMVTVQKGEAQVRQGSTDGKYVPPADDRAVFVRRTMPSDNSCLFHACAYLLHDKSRTEGPNLRKKCAEIVLANPDKFTTALLGQPPALYAQWLLQPTSWGGAIELMILSFLSQTEIIALDIESGRMERFGEMENFSVRGFVVYTGKHYDAIAMANPFATAHERDDQVLFNPRDDKVLQRAIRFVKEECKVK